jgi:hypothetical protein
MGIFDMFRNKKNGKSSEKSSTRSVVKSSKQPAKSGFLKHNAKKFIVMTKTTAGNVKANVNYAIDHHKKIFAVEDKGYANKGTYTPNSTSLAHAIARLKRDGHTVTVATGKNGYGETVSILFAKHGKPARAIARTATRAVKLKKAPAKKVAKKVIPATIIISGKRYKKEATYRGYKESATGYAKARAKDGYSARVRKYLVNGDLVYAVYTARKKQAQL